MPPGLPSSTLLTPPGQVDTGARGAPEPLAQGAMAPGGSVHPALPLLPLAGVVDPAVQGVSHQPGEGGGRTGGDTHLGAAGVTGKGAGGWAQEKRHILVQEKEKGVEHAKAQAKKKE